jgi:hypothetical protein
MAFSQSSSKALNALCSTRKFLYLRAKLTNSLYTKHRRSAPQPTPSAQSNIDILTEIICDQSREMKYMVELSKATNIYFESRTPKICRNN